MTEEERKADRKLVAAQERERALEIARDFRPPMAEAWREAEYPIKQRDAAL